MGIYREAKPAVYEAPEEIICRDEPLTENPYLENDRLEGGASVVVHAVPGPEVAGNLEATVRPGAESKLLADALIAHFFSELDTLVKNVAPPPKAAPEISSEPAVEAPEASSEPSVEVSEASSQPAVEDPKAIEAAGETASPESVPQGVSDSDGNAALEPTAPASIIPVVDKKSSEENP